MKKYILFIAGLLSANIGFAQTNNMEQYKDNPVHQTFPSSPDAASLGRYGDYPVSLATGLVDITIPLFEIGTKRIKLPITLSYHTSGITVDEIASSVGLGWTLNASGCIAVTIKDRGDFNGGFVNGSNQFMSTNEIDAISNNGEKLAKIHQLYGVSSSIDKESDIYSYNFNGYSGQFRYNKNKQIVSLTKDGLEIKQIDNSDIEKGYSITTNEGLEYIFDKLEHSKINHSITYINAFYLSKIKDLMNGEEISFLYSILGAGETAYTYTNYPNNAFLHQNDNNTSCYQPINTSIYNNFTQIQQYQGVLALSEIIFPQGKVKITLSNDRQDLRPHRISDIKLYSNQSPKTAIRKVIFNHNYFLSDSPSGINISERYKKRLRLDNIIIDNTKKYEFKYNSTKLPTYYDVSHQILGSTASSNYYSQDEWGYYNAKPNSHLLKDAPIGLSDANRTTDSTAIKACSLEEIIYPTSGKTRFEFEANRIYNGDNVGGLRIKRILNYVDKNSLQPNKIISYFYGSSGKLMPLYQDYKNSWRNLQEYTCCTYAYNNGQRYLSTSIEYRNLYFYGTSPLISNRYNNGTIVYYEQVTETTKDLNNNTQGHTIYDFIIDEPTYYLPAPNGFESENGQYQWTTTNHLYHKFMNVRNFRSGHLWKKRIYKDGNIQQEIENEYTTFGLEQNNIIGINFQKRVNYLCGNEGSHVSNSANIVTSSVSYNYHYFDIVAESGVKKVTKTTTTNYFDDGSRITDIVNYEYDNTFQSVKKATRTNSNGETVVTSINYSHNRYNPYYLGNPHIFDVMGQNNMRSFPIETITQVNGKTTSVFGTTYAKNSDGLIFPNSVFRLNISNPVTDYVPLYSDATHLYILDPRCTEEEQYTYYPNGNLKEIIYPQKNTRTTILWGYNNQYPVFILENTECAMIMAIHGNAIENIIGSNYPTDAQVFELREIINNTLGNTRNVTTYTHKPLVGVTSITDPRGITTYFEYDSFGRLKNTKDSDLKLLQEYNYHYKEN